MQKTLDIGIRKQILAFGLCISVDKFQFAVVLDRYFGEICKFDLLVQGSCQRISAHIPMGGHFFTLLCINYLRSDLFIEPQGSTIAGTLALLSTPSKC